MAARLFLNLTSGHWEWATIDNGDLPIPIPAASDAGPNAVQAPPSAGTSPDFSRADHIHQLASATDPGDIADPSIATAEDVGIAYNALLASLRLANVIA